MRLLIDAGNSRLKWALASRDGIASRAQAPHGGDAADALFESAWRDVDAVDRIVVASVAPLAFDTALDAFARRRFGCVPEFLRSPAAALGIRNAYREPARLGVDRFLGLAALHAVSARAQVLVGVGTAMTLDAIDADGTHLGGWIVPSPTLMRDAVLSRTARVGALEGALVEFADDTADGLQSGAINAAAGAIERFVANATRRFGVAPAIVTTGGGADALAPLVAGVDVRRDLVLDGLALWANADDAADSRRGER
jgi:type III pantothenate kinase